MTATATGFAPSVRQLEAIEAALGPVLVLAGPGAGKTLCLIERIRFLIERKGFDPARICAVTFTNKAAEEISERLGHALGERALRIKRGTLHALCTEILREHGEWVGARRGFGIADDEYQRDVLRRLRVGEKRRGGLLVRFGLHRTRGVPLSHDELRLFGRYREHLDRRGLLDFDDLVTRTAELIAGYGEIAESVAGRWDYLLVDEFQDLNPKQYAVIRQLASGHRNVFGVGDDEQSVYSWTGADPSVLREFVNDFGIRKELLLDENHRTARQIFEPAQRLLKQNPPLFGEKILRAERESSHPVSVVSFPDDGAELRWLLADLAADQASSGMSWGDYGVLYRVHRIGDVLEAGLIGAGIPCRLAIGRSLQDDPVVRYLLVALQVIAEPRDPIRQAGYFREVLPVPLWAEIVSGGERRKSGPLAWMRVLVRRRGREDEDAKKVRRAIAALQNLPALASRHTRLANLIEELLSQRVGEYRTVLEDRQDDLSDPALDGDVVKLAGRLQAALHGRVRVGLTRMAGLEIALSGMLTRGGVGCRILDSGSRGETGEVFLSPNEGGRLGLALGVFKALQLVHTRGLEDAFREFVAVDTETSSFDRTNCEIIELGAVRVRDGRAVEHFRRLIRPRVPVSEESRQVHGITNEELADQPILEDVWPEFVAFCGQDILIAHNGNNFDFPILRRLGRDLPGGADFVGYDSIPLARSLHLGSRKLTHLAEAFGIGVSQAHRALDDAQTLAQVFPRLQSLKLARARTTALSHLLDYLGLALVLSDPATVPEEAGKLIDVATAFALGRYSDCLDHYRLERARPGAGAAPTLEEVIERLGGQRRMQHLRREKGADERYPAAMTRLRRLLDSAAGESLQEELRSFLDRVALSHSGRDDDDPEPMDRVNLLTLHSTKGLEFSRVYVIGVEDGEFNRVNRDGRRPSAKELQEARRLLYVGMTRAKDRLVLTRAERRRNQPTGGTLFLTEMGLSFETP